MFRRALNRPTGQTEPRQTTAATLFQHRYAALDVETTGLFPNGNDRVIELGIVLFDLENGIEDEYETLVNPNRDVGAHHIHGLTASDLQHAPTFNEVCGDVANVLSGRVIVAHNSRFDAGFLSAEFARVGAQLPAIPHVCTMLLASREGLGRSLKEVCRTLRVNHYPSHTAMGDARAAAQVFQHCVQANRTKPPWSLQDLGCANLPSPVGWPEIPGTGRRTIRSEASQKAASERTYLASLVEKLPGSSANTDPEALLYWDLLDRALDDRHLSHEESDALISLATDSGMSVEDVRGVHRAYFDALVRQAWADGVVSSLEAADLKLVGEFLGIESKVVSAAIRQKRAASPAANDSQQLANDLPAGTTVCFTGALTATINGAPVTREQASEFASEAGLLVLESVTKKLDVLVVADPNSMSGKAKKARSYGTRIIAEQVFWSMIGVRVD